MLILFCWIVQMILFSKFAETYSMVALVNMVSAAIMLIALCRIKRFVDKEKDLKWNGDFTFVLHMIFFVLFGFIDGLVILISLCVNFAAANTIYGASYLTLYFLNLCASCFILYLIKWKLNK